MTSSTPPAFTPVEPIAFVPGIRGHDALAQYWLGQVMLRLRREVSWLWRERSLQTAGASASPLPPPVDRGLAALDLVRYEHDKRAFFDEDVTARYLSERIEAAEPVDATAVDRRGSFAWGSSELQLQPVERFVLAVALLPVVDSAAGQVIASCLNDPSRTWPTFALAQRLWDEPDQLVRCFDPAHALLRHGLLNTGGGGGMHDWQSGLAVPPLIASELLFGSGMLPAALELIAPVALPVNLDAAAVGRVAAAVTGEAAPGGQGVQIVPVVGAVGAPLGEVAAACADRAGVRTVRPSTALAREHLGQALTAAWLRGHAVYLPASSLSAAAAHDAVLEPPPLPGLPLTLFVGVHDRALLSGLGATLPAIVVPPSTYAERLARWREALPSAGAVLPELARRFRYEHAAIARVGREQSRRARIGSAARARAGRRRLTVAPRASARVARHTSTAARRWPAASRPDR